MGVWNSTRNRRRSTDRKKPVAVYCRFFNFFFDFHFSCFFVYALNYISSCCRYRFDRRERPINEPKNLNQYKKKSTRVNLFVKKKIRNCRGFVVVLIGHLSKCGVERWHHRFLFEYVLYLTFRVFFLLVLECVYPLYRCYWNSSLVIF